jgi:4-hydroxythreonine-4-phosphate dehydrogenase
VKKQQQQNKFKVGISIGDVAGIGLEVIIKTFSDSRIFERITPIIYANPAIAKAYRKGLNINDFSFNLIKNVEEANPKRVNIIDVTNEELKFNFGVPSKVTGDLALKSLESATADLAANKIDALVTAPIDKNTIQSKGFNFPGHTEYLTKMANVEESLMLMIEEDLKVGVVTGHVPIKDIAANITEDKILKKLHLTNQSLINDFGIEKPKIAVLGLNPHAGDKGVIGEEELTIIIPAIERANDEGILTFGPYPADGFFGSGNFTNFDAILAMYHDQGLIPFKTLAYMGGVNFTAGLPIVRTSPAHGTAYDIAGKGIADETSFREAVFAAYDIFHTRKKSKDWTENPLKQKSEPEKEKTID